MKTQNFIFIFLVGILTSSPLLAKQLVNEKAMHTYEAMSEEETELVFEQLSKDGVAFDEAYKGQINKMEYNKALTVVYRIEKREDEEYSCQKIYIWSGYESRDWQMNDSKLSETYICESLQ